MDTVDKTFKSVEETGVNNIITEQAQDDKAEDAVTYEVAKVTEMIIERILIPLVTVLLLL